MREVKNSKSLLFLFFVTFGFKLNRKLENENSNLMEEIHRLKLSSSNENQLYVTSNLF